MSAGNNRGRPILQKLLFPVTLLIVMVVLLVSWAIFGSGMIKQLEKNASDILSEKVINRKNYLENEMIGRWSYVMLTAEKINHVAQELLDSGMIDMETLDTDSGNCVTLIHELSEDLISMLRNNDVNGVFVVFNTEDLSKTAAGGTARDKPGFYVRDLDASSVPSYQNADLLLLCSPAETVRDVGISTDSAWNTAFDFSGYGYYPFLYEPFMAAYGDTSEGGEMELYDYGYWSDAYRLPGDARTAFSYSVPLILEDGTVYGVLGVEVLQDSLRNILPYEEIADGRLGTYILAKDSGGTLDFDPILVNGLLGASVDGHIQLKETQSASENAPRHTIQTATDTLYCSVEYLNLYNANTPFSGQRWAVIGAVRPQELFGISRRVVTTLVTAIVLALIIGLFGSLAVSWLISRPVAALSREMRGTNPNDAIRLNRTGIVEIDRLVGSVETLSRNVIDSANKFSKIIEMASIKIAGFEICTADDSLFITHNFFEMMGRSDIDVTTLTPATLRSHLDALSDSLIERDDADGKPIYRIPQGNAHVYIKLTLSRDGAQTFGLIEDVTRDLLEVEKIEHERDHDVLTSLKNRRAFGRNMEKLFEHETESLKTAAMVMIDLDNLKHYNDTYGHEAGDIYIRSAGQCFLRHTPVRTLLSRISGDEFCMFFYGYETRDEIREVISKLRDGINDCDVRLNDGSTHALHISAGVAWYPEDAQEHDLLLKYADFAMYKVKRSGKNEFAEFDAADYQRNLILQQSKADLSELIEKNLMSYHFQPIISAESGEIIAYEALMKPETPTLTSPAEVINLARMESKLGRIETLTWMNAMKAFTSYIKAGLIAPTCKIFIHSISSQALSDEDMRTFEGQFADYLQNIVIEMTEDEEFSADLLDAKVERIRTWNGEIALNDYGTGYNSDMALLKLNPKYIKIDMALVRGIDADVDRQKLVSNLISYAHERDMLVIAEGVETKGEFDAARKMQIDCMQGYFIAHPNAPPPYLAAETQTRGDKANG